jgi:hypothetical protein
MHNHDPTNYRITQQRNELTLMPIERRTDLNNDLIDRDLLGCEPPGHPRSLTIQIRFLIGQRNACIHSRAPTSSALPSRSV